MTNLRNLNQTHPFWDFVNAMQNGGNNNNNRPNNGEGQQDQRDVRFAEGSWNRGPWGYPPGGFPQQSANIPVREEKTFTSSNEKQTNINEKDMTPETADPMDGGAPAYEDVDPPVEAPEEEEEEDSPAEEATSAHPHRRSRHGPGHRSRSRHRQERREAKEARREQHEQNKQHRRSGFGRGGGSRGGPFGFAFGGRGGHFPCGGGPRGFGPGPHHHGPPPPGGPHSGPHGSPVDLPAWASWIQSNFIDPYVGNNNNSSGNGNRNFPFVNNNNNNNNDQDFTPAIDIFSTGEAFVVHVSLPGASKEDIAVNWETETSTLVVSGVIHRPGDEELLSAIEVSERQVGAFERRVVLGTRTEPAYVDQDAIGAKLQDGILRVEVPKIQREEGYVEIRKVDIQ